MTDKDLLLKYNLLGAERLYTFDFKVYDEETILKALRSAEERNQILLGKIRAKVEEIKQELGGK